MLIKSIKYCYDDVAIMPTVTSCVEHRKQCKPYDENGFLPIFTAPMSSVINSENFELFEKNNIYGILPRSEPYETRLNYCLNNKWSAFSLAEFKDLFCDEQLVDNYKNMPKKALIDVANGHMKVLFKIIKKAKELYGESLTIMMGNIANPETYFECAKCGVDYVRCSIGSGMGCITSSNLGLHFPNASLIDAIVTYKRELKKSKDLCDSDLPKIIADGGIRNYSDVNKALALGADYVMIGGLFSQLVESCAKTFYYNKDNDLIELFPLNGDNIIEHDGIFSFEKEGKIFLIDKIYKVFYGMASKNGQIDINGKKLKTSEGITKTLECTTNLSKWTENMSDYLKSAMSYTNCTNLIQFKNNVDCIIISENSKKSINK